MESWTQHDYLTGTNVESEPTNNHDDVFYIMDFQKSFGLVLSLLYEYFCCLSIHGHLSVHRRSPEVT